MESMTVPMEKTKRIVVSALQYTVISMLDYVEKPGSKCNFNATGMCGWEEKALPLRRDGKKIFLRGKLLPNMSLVDDQNNVLESYVMRETPRPDSGILCRD